MPRRRYIFDPPDRFVAGTVGEPGNRTFFLQAREGGRVVSVALEKVQVAVLAERLGELLDELDRRGIVEAVGDRAAIARRRRGAAQQGVVLDEPLNEAFRAGSLTLGWDGGAERVLVEARAQDEDGEAIDPDEDDDEDEDGPDLLRVRMTAAAARTFVARAAQVVAAGRPPCPLCGHRSIRRATSARGATATTSTSGADDARPRVGLEVLRDGEIDDRRAARRARATTRCSCTVTRPCPDPASRHASLEAIHKPTAGERPLDDFPDGTLTRREVAAYLVSEASGWDIVPPTVMRDGPFGEGMLQAFIEPDPTVDVIGWSSTTTAAAPDGRVRRRGQQHRSQGRPHPAGRGRPPRLRRRPRRVLLGDPKLRTVLWGWRGGAPARRRAGRAAPDSRRPRRRPRERPAARCSAVPRFVRRPARRTTCSSAGCSRSRRRRWPAIPWPPI